MLWLLPVMSIPCVISTCCLLRSLHNLQSFEVHTNRKNFCFSSTLNISLLTSDLWKGFHIKQFSDTSWVSHNWTQLWYYPRGDSFRSHRWWAQSCKTAPFQTPISSPGCYLGFWLIGYIYKSKVPTTPSRVPLFGITVCKTQNKIIYQISDLLYRL